MPPQKQVPSPTLAILEPTAHSRTLVQDDFVYIISSGARQGEITLDYCQNDNSGFMSQFGFMLEGNMNDTIALGEPDAGKISEQKVDATLAISDSEESLRCDPQQALAPVHACRALALLHVWACSFLHLFAYRAVPRSQHAMRYH